MSNISKTVTDTKIGSIKAQIWNRPCTIDWHHDLWPWMKLNCPSSISLNGDRYDVAGNRSRIGSRPWPWAINWYHDLWIWM